MTISRYLRNLRLERAAELLRGGRSNVTEAAMVVGYSASAIFPRHSPRCSGCARALFRFTEDRAGQ